MVRVRHRSTSVEPSDSPACPSPRWSYWPWLIAVRLAPTATVPIRRARAAYTRQPRPAPCRRGHVNAGSGGISTWAGGLFSARSRLCVNPCSLPLCSQSSMPSSLQFRYTDKSGFPRSSAGTLKAPAIRRAMGYNTTSAESTMGAGSCAFVVAPSMSFLICPRMSHPPCAEPPTFRSLPTPQIPVPTTLCRATHDCRYTRYAVVLCQTIHCLKTGLCPGLNPNPNRLKIGLVLLCPCVCNDHHHLQLRLGLMIMATSGLVQG